MNITNLLCQRILKCGTTTGGGESEQLTACLSNNTALQNQLSGARAQIAGLTAQVAGLSGQVAPLQTQVNALSAQLGACQASGAALQTQVNVLTTQLNTSQTNEASLNAQLVTLFNDLVVCQNNVAGLLSQINVLTGQLADCQANGGSNTNPVITSGVNFTMVQNAATIATMTATDNAPGLVWSISPQVGGSNANAALFTITSSGVLSGLGGQTSGSYLVRVRVTDAGGLFSEKDVVVAVSGASNASPVITSGTNFAVFQNATTIATMTATDNAPGLVWSISPQVGGSNANAALFAITSNGELSGLSGQPPGSYLVRVRVTDAGGLISEKDIVVAVNVFTSNVYPIDQLGFKVLQTAPYTAEQMARNLGGFWQPTDITPSTAVANSGVRLFFSPADIARGQAVAAAGTDPKWIRTLDAAQSSIAHGNTVLFGGQFEIYQTASYQNGVPCAAVYLALGNSNPALKAQCLARVETILDQLAWMTTDAANPSGTQFATFSLTPGGDRDIRNVRFGGESQAYGFRYIMPAVAEMLDWCADGLSPSVRQRTATWLMDWVEAFVPAAYWPTWNKDIFVNWANYPISFFGNYTWVNLGSIAISTVAAYGRDTRSGPKSGANRPAYIKTWYEKMWNDCFHAMWFTRGDGTGGAGGASYSTAYEQSTHFASPIRAWELAFSDTTSLNRSYFNQHLEWHLQRVMPGLKNRWKLGEDKRSDSFGSQQSFNWHRLLGTLMAANDPVLRAQAWKMLDLAGAPYTTDPRNEDIIDYVLPIFMHDLTAPRAVDLTGLSKSFFASGIQHYQYRDKLPNDATGVAWSVDYGRGLMRHQGALEVFAGGGWVLPNADAFPWAAGSSGSGLMHGSYCYSTANIYSADGYYIQAEWQDAGEPYDLGYSPMLGTTNKWYGNQTDFAYCAGVAATSYRGGSRSGSKYGPNRVDLGGTQIIAPSRDYLNDWTRKVVYVDPLKTWVVLDRFELTNPADTFCTQWLGQGTPVLAGQTFKLITPSIAPAASIYDVFGQQVSGGGAITQQHISQAIGQIPFQDGGQGATNFDIVEVKKSGAGVQYLLQTLQLGLKAASAAPNSVSTQIIASGYGRGVLIGGTHVVMVSDTETVAVGWNYEVNAIRHCVTDLAPNTVYAVRRQALGGGADLAAQNIATDAAGVLVFSTPSGAFRHVIGV